MAELKKLLKENSYLILSGILLEKESSMNNVLREKKLKIIDRKRKNDWVALMLSL